MFRFQEHPTCNLKEKYSGVASKHYLGSKGSILSISPVYCNGVQNECYSESDDVLCVN